MKLKNKFQDYLSYLHEKGHTPKTIREHKRFLDGALSHSVADIRISKLRLTDVSKVIEAGKEHGQYGSQRSVVTLRCYLRYLHELGVPLRFDYRDIEVPRMPEKVVEYLTPDELNLIREVFNPDKIRKDNPNRTQYFLATLRTRALIEILLDTGMRISELTSLNKDDIDWEQKEAKIINVKTKDTEKVYFTDRSLSWLKRYLEMRKDNSPALFISGRDRLLSVTARSYLREHTKNLEIRKHIKHHIFRKTFATTLIKDGATLKETQYLCRHRSERTTLKHYIGVCKDNAKAVHQRIFGKI